VLLRASVVRRARRDASDAGRADLELTERLQEHVKANLARYKVPRDIVFVDELPRNATGKVLKRELATYDDE
jgi:acyl-coenzyme A synthetase/AMP-(fatty) acid ligase